MNKIWDFTCLSRFVDWFVCLDECVQGVGWDQRILAAVTDEPFFRMVQVQGLEEDFDSLTSLPNQGWNLQVSMN